MTDMTVAAALNQLKILKDRIDQALLSRDEYVNTTSSGMVLGISQPEYERRVIARWDSLNALVRNRSLIKAAIVESNAKTTVTIGIGPTAETMTVAAAIERKRTIETDQLLLNLITQQYDRATTAAQRANEGATTDAHRQAVAYFGDKVDKTGKEYTDFIQAYTERYKTVLVDPLKLADKVTQLRDRIENFRANVDLALTTSNVTTPIVVDLA